MEKPPKTDGARYVKTCRKCKTENIVYTQDDDGAEYHTSVYVPCNRCGNLLRFVIPVN